MVIAVCSPGEMCFSLCLNDNERNYRCVVIFICFKCFFLVACKPSYFFRHVVQHLSPWPPASTNFWVYATQTLIWVRTWSDRKTCLYPNICNSIRDTTTLYSDLRFTWRINDDCNIKDKQWVITTKYMATGQRVWVK